MASEVNDCEISMDVESERVLGELMTIRHTTCIEDMDYEVSFTNTLLSSSNQTVVMQTNSLILVIDTNVLLSNLSFLMELRTMLFPNISKILFLIPWVVLQELDYIKSSNPSLNKNAREAINFLHHEFKDSSKNIIGQTMDADLSFVQRQAGVRFNNDDRILHCCLEQSKKWEDVNVVVIMFTNDKNLVTKCQVNSASVVSRKNILPFIRGLTSEQSYVPLSPPPVLSTNTAPTPVNSKIPDSSLAESSSATYTEAMDYAISVSRPVLIGFIEEKMKAIYGKMWIQICCVKPPWSMLDVLSLLDKHWIAVFTDFSSCSIRESIVGLKACLLDAERNGCRLEHISYTLEHIQNIFYTFSRHIAKGEETVSILVGLQREVPKFMSSPLSPMETRIVTSTVSDMTEPSEMVSSQPYPSYPIPPPSPVNSISPLDWAFSSMLEYINNSKTQKCLTSELVGLLENFLLNMNKIVTETHNVSPTNLKAFTNSLNALLSHSVRSNISIHINTVGSLLSSPEYFNIIRTEFLKFVGVYNTLT